MMPGNSFSIWKVALFGGLLAFSALFWLNGHVGYQAKSAILVQGTGNTSDDILAETIAAFARTETFKERTLRSTRLQESLVGQMEESDRVKLIENVKAKGGKTGGLITVVSKTADSEIAEIVSTESTETLLRMTHLYVGDQQELSLIVIDRAITSKTIVEPYTYVFKSIGSAIVLFVIFLLLQPIFQWSKKQMKGLPKPFGKASERKEEEVYPVFLQEERDERFVPQKLDPAFLYPEREIANDIHVSPQPKASEVVKGEVYGEGPKNALQSVSVSMDDLPFTFETPAGEGESQPTPETTYSNFEKEEPVSPEREPTVVEYKRRLNELLAQK